MAPAAFGTVYLLLALIALPQVLAALSCAHNDGKPGCIKKCRPHQGSGSYHMSHTSVISSSKGDDPNNILPTACGSNIPATPDPVVIPTDSSHCSSIPSTPKDSGTSPTPKLTSTSPPPAATPSTPTSTPQSHSPSTTVKNDPTSSPPPAQVSSPSNQSSSVPDSVKKAALDAHNSFRALHGAGELTWDDTVATYAVDQSSKCVFEHSNGPYGENLAVGTGPFTVTDGINMWTGEAGDYDPNNPTYSHFTQVVWKSTKQLGCAFTTCSPGTIYPEEYGNSLLLWCNYFPPGNVDGQYGENVQK